MKTYLITYDLKKEGQSYNTASEKIIKAIKELGPAIHVLTTTWVVKTSFTTATQVSDHLRKSMDNNDYLLASQMCSDRQGWLPQIKWDWINSAPSCC